MASYVQKINGNYLAAYEVVPNSPLADQLAAIGAGAFQVAEPVNPSADPPDYTPDVTNPSSKIIYLTKDPNAPGMDPYYEWIYTTETGQVSAEWKCIGETSIDLTGYKRVQTAVADPTASGTGLDFIATASQDAQGVITVTKSTVQDGTTSQKGVVQLQGTIGASESSDTTAATPKAVRDAINDLDVTAISVGASKTLTSISETDGKISATATDIQISESQVTDLTTDLAAKADKSTAVTNIAYDTANKVITKTINGTTTDVVSLSQIESDLDLSNKADKVSNATSGNFAGLDSNGNLTDSGSKASDFATSAQGVNADSALQGGIIVGESSNLPVTNNILQIPKAVSGTAAQPGNYGVVQIECIDI